MKNAKSLNDQVRGKQVGTIAVRLELKHLPLQFGSMRGSRSRSPRREQKQEPVEPQQEPLRLLRAKSQAQQLCLPILQAVPKANFLAARSPPAVKSPPLTAAAPSRGQTLEEQVASSRERLQEQVAKIEFDTLKDIAGVIAVNNAKIMALYESELRSRSGN